MNAFDVGCRWFGACAALVMLSACHGSPAQSGTLPNVVSSAELGKSVSWMALEAASEDLLYLSDVVANDVKVYSFREGRLVGTLTGFGKPRSECADEAGNVWIADIEGRDVIEYPHGGTKPIASLDTFGVPLGCSVDSAGHYLAVAGGISGAIVSIYHEGSHGRWSDPKRYTDSAMRIPYFCGYDSNGNLFIDGLTKSKAGRFTLVELRRRSKSFESIAVSQAIDTPGQVQWDGKDLAIGGCVEFDLRRQGCQQRVGVRQVAVVAKSKRPEVSLFEKRLRVDDDRRARRRVARMPDRNVAA